MKYIILFLLTITLTSCFDEDSYVIQPVSISEVNSPYDINDYQTYFNLADTMVVSHNGNSDWDLGFESSTLGFHIILNSSKFMFAGNTGLTDFNSVTSIGSLSMGFDKSSGNLDSTVIGNWVDYSDVLNPVYPKNVYIINRGTDNKGVSYGLKKIVFEKLENNIYYIHYANLDNSDEQFFQVPKNASANFVLFSFNDGGNLNTQQPNKDLWDLLITKYSTILYDNNNTPTPYPVRGVLINNGVSVARDTVTPFNSITYENIRAYTFSTKQDAIGYNWKKYSNGNYLLIDNCSYIIHDRNNDYYKLRFTSYKNSIKGDIHYGSDGYPSFEYTKLESI